MSRPESPRFVLLMGVAGSGKTTIGRRVSTALRWPYYEADDFHSPANKEKMGSGIPLTDDDRRPWLGAIREKMEECRQRNEHGVFTCSALKNSYREQLIGDATDVLLVFLQADLDTITQRVSRRQGHYMKADMVRSQFEILEAPADALTADAREHPDTIVARIVTAVRGAAQR